MHISKRSSCYYYKTTSQLYTKSISNYSDAYFFDRLYILAINVPTKRVPVCLSEGMRGQIAKRVGKISEPPAIVGLKAFIM